ncbi:MAG: type II restriction endonuclease [Deltaproteobacteria bacterium]
MIYLDFYKNLNCNNEDEVFSYLIDTLKPSITLWTYFVNWDKVLDNTNKIELHLNVLNYLIGKDNFDEEFRKILRQYPSSIEAIPALVVRDGQSRKRFKILVDFNEKKLTYADFDFSKKKLDENDIENYLLFIEKTGLKELLQSRKIKSLVDYMIGVEAGIDSNARKNRGGKSMEYIVEVFVDDLCERSGYEYLKEADSIKIKRKWDYNVPVDKSSRRYDFVIHNGKEIFLIETNFYGGGGSKLKSTAGEYRNLYDVLRNKHKFIWITDGYGWKSSARPLRETFDHNDYLFNLNMIENGILEEILR